MVQFRLSFRKGSVVLVRSLHVFPAFVNSRLIFLEFQLLELATGGARKRLQPYLFVSSSFDGLLQWLNMIPCVHSRLDDSCIYHVDLVQQVVLQLRIGLLELHRPHHDRPRCFHGFATFTVLAGLGKGRVHILEIVGKPLLDSENINPGISPCFRSINDLGTVRTCSC